MSEPKYYYPSIECIDEKGLRDLQEDKLKKMVKYVYENSKFYREKFEKEGLRPNDIKSLEDLEKIPLTSRDELYENQVKYGPFTHLPCLPISSSGICIVRTGVEFSVSKKPLYVMVHDLDSRMQADLMARGLWSMGVRRGSCVYITSNPAYNVIYMNLTTAVARIGGVAVQAAAERTLRTVRVFMPMFPPHFLFSTPTYAKYLLKVLLKENLKFQFKAIIGWGEVGFSVASLRRKMEEAFSEVSTEEVKVYDSYGLSEVGMLAMECEEQKGMHCFEDSYIYEVVNPSTMEKLEPGEIGELVVTTINRTATPLMRYRTGDLVSMEENPCRCGRTHVKIKEVHGRLDQKLRLNDKELYLSMIEEVVNATPGLTGEFLVIRKGRDVTLILERKKEADRHVIEKAVEKLGHVNLVLREEGEDELLMAPHRAVRILSTDDLEWYREVLAEQRRMEI